MVAGLEKNAYGIATCAPPGPAPLPPGGAGVVDGAVPGAGPPLITETRIV